MLQNAWPYRRLFETLYVRTPMFRIRVHLIYIIHHQITFFKTALAAHYDQSMQSFKWLVSVFSSNTSSHLFCFVFRSRSFFTVHVFQDRTKNIGNHPTAALFSFLSHLSSTHIHFFRLSDQIVNTQKNHNYFFFLSLFSDFWLL